jgi:hypothetical protein
VLGIGEIKDLSTVTLQLKRLSVTGKIELESDDNSFVNPAGTLVTLERVSNLSRITTQSKNNSNKFRSYSVGISSAVYTGMTGGDGSFRIEGIPAGVYNVTAQRDNQVLLCKHEEHSDWAAVLHTDEQIRASARWLNGRAIILENVWDGGYNNRYWGHWSSSDWGGESFYIGLCVMDHETPIYGWVKIACVHSGIEWEIYECAYQTSPNSVQESEDHLNFTLRPNPARDYIYLDNPDGLNIHQEIHVKIYNKLGVIMDEFTYTDPEYRYCISDYPPGLYFCSIGYEGEEEFKVIKFIIN